MNEDLESLRAGAHGDEDDQRQVTALALIDIAESLRDLTGRHDVHCRVCHCTNFHPCITDMGPCSWVEPDLCSRCFDPDDIEGKT